VTHVKDNTMIRYRVENASGVMLTGHRMRVEKVIAEMAEPRLARG
jgi:hypothetical protein